jgi:hypothetical protein
VAIKSSALFPADNVTCTFGNAVVPGSIRISGSVQPGNSTQLLRLLLLSCESPQLQPADVDLTVTMTSGSYTSTFVAPFTFYAERRLVELEEQGSLNIWPPWIDISGSDNITIRGEGAFSFNDHPRLRLVQQQNMTSDSGSHASSRRLLSDPGAQSSSSEIAFRRMLDASTVALS